MATDSLISIIGEHFYLQSQLDYSQESGFSLAKTIIGRVTNTQGDYLPENHMAAALLLNHESSPGNLHLQAKTVKYSRKVVSNPVSLINKELQNKILIWELNFLNFGIYSAEHNLSKNINFAKLAADSKFLELLEKFDLPRNLVFNSLNNYPLTAGKYHEQIVNDYVLSFFTREFFNIGEECDLLIITGEMLWSGWLTTYMLIKLLSAFVKTDCKIIFDFSGMWQILLRLNQEFPQIFRIGREFFAEQLYFIYDQKKSAQQRDDNWILPVKKGELKRELLLDTGSINFFDLQEDGFWLEDNLTRLPRYLLVNSPALNDREDRTIKNVPDWWKDYPVRQFLKSTFSLTHYRKLEILPKQIPVTYSGEINLNRQKDLQVRTGEQFGTINIKAKAFLDYRKESATILNSLLVTDGQIVEEGEKIAVIKKLGSFIKEAIFSPIRGIINLDDIAKGIITIEQPDEPQPLLAPFSGQMLRFTKNNTVIFQTQCLQIPYFKLAGLPCSGILQPKSHLNDKKQTGQPRAQPEDFTYAGNIALLHSLKEFDWQVNDLVMKKICGMIIPACTEEELAVFLKKYHQQLQQVSLVMIDEFSAAADIQIMKIFNKFLGKLLIIDNDYLNIPLEFGEIKLFRERLHMERKKLAKRDYVKIINYRYNNFYAKVEKELTAADFLLNNGDEYLEADISNIISLNYG